MTEYVQGLTAAGFADATVTFTHEAAPGMHGAIVRATKPDTHQSGSPNQHVGGQHADTATGQGSCCTPAAHATCCDASAKTSCCGPTGDGAPPATCGCQ